MNLSRETYTIRHGIAVAAGTSVITPSTGVDCRGYRGCMFVVSWGTITTSGVQSVEVHSSTDDGVADAYALVADTNRSVSDASDGMLTIIDVANPPERFLKCVVNRSIANAVLDGIVAVLYDPYELPTPVSPTLQGRTFVGPSGAAVD